MKGCGLRAASFYRRRGGEGPATSAPQVGRRGAAPLERAAIPSRPHGGVSHGSGPSSDQPLLSPPQPQPGPSPSEPSGTALTLCVPAAAQRPARSRGGPASRRGPSGVRGRGRGGRGEGCTGTSHCRDAGCAWRRRGHPGGVRRVLLPPRDELCRGRPCGRELRKALRF